MRLVRPLWLHFCAILEPKPGCGIKSDAMSIPDFIGVAAKLMP